MIILHLFYEFLKIGLFSVGGGMATLPFLYDLADKTGWFTQAQVADMLAVSESTPGPVGINMATYVGYTTAGIPGALAATIGIIVPGIVLVILIRAALGKIRNSRYVDGAFYGLRPASTALIAAAGILVAKVSLVHMELFQLSGDILDLIDLKSLLLAAALLVLTRWVKATKNLHPIVFIAVSSIIGIVFTFSGA